MMAPSKFRALAQVMRRSQELVRRSMAPSGFRAPRPSMTAQRRRLMTVPKSSPPQPSSPSRGAGAVDDGADALAGWVWLSGGAEGTLAKVTITVTTDGGRTYTELALLPIGGGPIDLARAKAHLKVDWDDDDALIASLSARRGRAIEHRTDRALSPRVFTEWAPRFPCVPPSG
jgi:hypothetical protein